MYKISKKALPFTDIQNQHCSVITIRSGFIDCDGNVICIRQDPVCAETSLDLVFFSELFAMTVLASSAAFTSPTSIPSTIQSRRQISVRGPRCQCNQKSTAISKQSRRRVLQYISLLPLASKLVLDHPSPANAISREKKLESMVTPVIMCQTIMTPVRRYIEEGAWDKGRTNVNYCTRVLALRKNMKETAELLDGDSYFDAMDIMGEMSNTMTQLDASLYTPLFIPSDEGISVEQMRYQREARSFYQDAIKYLDDFLKCIPTDIVSSAKASAAKAKYEIKFEAE